MVLEELQEQDATIETDSDQVDIEQLIDSVDGGNEESPEDGKQSRPKSTDWNSVVDETLQNLAESKSETVEDQPKEESEDKKDLTPEEIMKELENEDPEDADTKDQESAESVGKVEIEHKGEKITLEGEKIKELAQQGYDYTQKTQKLAEERKSWETEKEAADKEYTEAITQLQEEYGQFDEQLKTKQQWDFVLDAIKTDDPDLYDQIQDRFQSHSKFFRNPVVDSEIQKLRKELQEVKAQTTQKETVDTIKSFDSEMGTVKEKYKAVNVIGLKPDWEKVKEKWANSDKPVETVFLEMYGADMNKLYQSKLKVKKTKDKTKQKSPTVGSITKTPGVGSKKKGGVKVTNHMETVNRIMQQM